MSDDPAERKRAYLKIAPSILEFAGVIGSREFHVDTMRKFVILRVGKVAPDSPGRVLRELRLEGRLDYSVLNRRQSLYKFHPNANTNQAGDP
jgi:hypothetical protein